MQNIALFCIVALFTVSPVLAKDVPPKATVILAEENHVALNDGKTTPSVFAYVESRLSRHVGLFGFVLGSRRYAEAYAGPSMFFGPFTLGVGAGYEQANKPWRVALTSSLMLTKFRGLLMAEHGGSGPWVRAILAGVPIPQLGIGAFAETGRGIGPYVDVMPTPTKFPFSIYAAVPYGPLNPQGSLIAGIRLYL